jgi:penicillin-insensitive murein endopeptidase
MSEQLCRYLSTFAVVLLVLGSMAGLGQTSRCYGTPADGRLVGGVKLPVNGPNFRAYSQLAHTLGRVYLHDRVADLVIATYQALETSRPETMFVYGETGWKHGGSFRPHRTHQNGLSVDFMVPVLDEKGSPTDLPTYALNRYGYGIEFDDGGRFNGLQVDFVALADHLYQLHRLATARGIGISKIFLDPAFHTDLARTRNWQYLRANLPFSPNRQWVRHDDHYHVDFSLLCEPG